MGVGVGDSVGDAVGACETVAATVGSGVLVAGGTGALADGGAIVCGGPAGLGATYLATSNAIALAAISSSSDYTRVNGTRR